MSAAKAYGWMAALYTVTFGAVSVVLWPLIGLWLAVIYILGLFCLAACWAWESTL